MLNIPSTNTAEKEISFESVIYLKFYDVFKISFPYLLSICDFSLCNRKACQASSNTLDIYDFNDIYRR